MLLKGARRPDSTYQKPYVGRPLRSGIHEIPARKREVQLQEEDRTILKLEASRMGSPEEGQQATDETGS